MSIDPKDEQILAFTAYEMNILYPETFTRTSSWPNVQRAGYHPRSFLEGNHDWKQVIVYVVAIHGSDIFVYQRGKNGYDARLHQESSIGVGGHVSLDDVLASMDIHDVAMAAAKRELAEEVTFGNIWSLEPYGVINDNSNDVGLDHMGFVFTAHVSGGWLINEPEAFSVLRCGYYPMDNLPKREYENWSQILIEEFLGK